MIPFLDHLVSVISTRFTAHGKTAASIQELLLNSITLIPSFGMIEKAVSFYNDDLPNPTIINAEFCRWKSKWLLVPKSLKECSQAALPNFYYNQQLLQSLAQNNCEQIFLL